MSLQVKRLHAPLEIKDADDESGDVVAKFSTFDIVDRSGDIVRKSAFTDGQTALMVWAHDWTKPVGKGVVRVHEGHATFEGKFWRDTEDGEQAYRKVKNAGDLQEWSWGFRVLDTASNDAINGYDITKAELFEVSPVLVGANQETATLAVKSEFCPTCGHKNAHPEPAVQPAAEPEPDGSGDVDMAGLINELERERLDLEAAALI